MKASAVLCAIVLLACGGSGGDGGAVDAGPTVDGGGDAGPVACDEADRVARFTITSTPEVGGVYGEYLDGPPPELIATQAEQGGCRYVGPSPALCDPACGGSEICDVHGDCVAFPVAIRAGTLRIRGTEPPLDLEPQPGETYYTTELLPDLFRPGDVVTMALTGDVAPPLSLATIGIPPLALPTTQLTATRHQPMTVEWTAVAEPAGAEVVLHMDNDHHGIRAFVECAAPASAGTLTVPADILDLLIAAGKTGIGTYIENAYVLLRHRAVAPTSGGCATFDAEDMRNVLVETILAD